MDGPKTRTSGGNTLSSRRTAPLKPKSGLSGPPANTEGLSCPANTNNQLTTCSFGYDAAGNMTSNNPFFYTYDAENRLIWTSGYRYIYDGDGQRVEKCAAATATTPCPTSGTNGTLYWRGTGGDTQAESDLSGNLQEEYIYFNGQRIARRDASTGAVHYYFSDHLGSTSIVTDAVGTLSLCGSYSVATGEDESDYYPYGGEIVLCNRAPENYKFTGQERDSESGLDYFGARHYTSAIGRFMVPDPAGILAQEPSAPQSWNLYSYAQNMPLRAIDPNGLDCVYVNSMPTFDASSTGGTSPGPPDMTFHTGDDGNTYGVLTGDCASGTDNGFYFDGTVDATSLGLNPNGDVVGSVDSGSGFSTGCSGDCPESLISETANGYQGDVPIYGIGGQGALILQTAGLEAAHGLSCAGYGFLAGNAGAALFQAGQPVAGIKRFRTPGTTVGPSPISETLRDAVPQKMPFRVPTPVGGPGTGTPLRLAYTNKAGAAIGRYAPYVGAALTIYSAYKLNQCLSEVPK